MEKLKIPKNSNFHLQTTLERIVISINQLKIERSLINTDNRKNNFSQKGEMLYSKEVHTLLDHKDTEIVDLQMTIKKLKSDILAKTLKISSMEPPFYKRSIQEKEHPMAKFQSSSSTLKKTSSAATLRPIVTTPIPIDIGENLALKDIISDLENQIQSVRGDREEEVRDLKQEIERLLTEGQTLKQKNQMLSSEVHLRSRQGEDAIQVNHVKEMEIQKQKNEVQDLLNQQSQAIGSLEAEITRLREEIGLKDRLISSQDIKISSMASKKSILKERIETAEFKNSEYLVRLQNGEQQLEQAKEAHINEVQVLTNNFKILEEQYSISLNKLKEESSQQLQAYLNENEALKMDKEGLCINLTKLENQVLTLKQKSNTYLKTKNELEFQQNYFKNEAIRFQKETKNAQNRQYEAEERQSKFEVFNDRLKKQVSTLKKEIESLKNNISDQESQIKKMKIENEISYNISKQEQKTTLQHQDRVNTLKKQLKYHKGIENVLVEQFSELQATTDSLPFQQESGKEINHCQCPLKGTNLQSSDFNFIYQRYDLLHHDYARLVAQCEVIISKWESGILKKSGKVDSGSINEIREMKTILVDLIDSHSRHVGVEVQDSDNYDGDVDNSSYYTNYD